MVIDVKLIEIFSFFYDFSITEWNFQTNGFALWSEKIFRTCSKISTIVVHLSRAIFTVGLINRFSPTGLPNPREKYWIFCYPGNSLNIGRFLVLHQDRIVKLLTRWVVRGDWKILQQVPSNHYLGLRMRCLCL